MAIRSSPLCLATGSSACGAGSDIEDDRRRSGASRRDTCTTCSREEPLEPANRHQRALRGELTSLGAAYADTRWVN